MTSQHCHNAMTANVIIVLVLLMLLSLATTGLARANKERSPYLLGFLQGKEVLVWC
jgi:hypothetical protein